MTKDYYSNLTPTETQLTRNFAEYCKNMPEEEKAFFEKFGIDTSKITIAGTYDKKEKMLFCFGEAYFCGDYLKTDFPEPIFSEQDTEDYDVLLTIRRRLLNSAILNSFLKEKDFLLIRKRPMDSLLLILHLMTFRGFWMKSRKRILLHMSQ
jgi:hypothetical protein